MTDHPAPTPDAGPGEAAGGHCDNCGRADPPLVPVHRVYLELDRLGAVTGHRREPAEERWCEACRATYPHEPVEAPGDGTA